ncbi:MAG TPA: hypothetical protein VGF55_31950, partial [Gemmataceae bacterium]
MYRAFRWLGPIALVAAVPVTRADGPTSPGDRFKALIEELKASDQRFDEEYKAAKTDEERTKATDASLDRRAAIARKMIAVAETAPADPATAAALVLAFQITGPGPEKQKALDLILKDHITSDRLAPICPTLVYTMPDDDRALRIILEKNPHHDVRGNACFSLARVLKARADRGGANTRHDLDEAERLFERTAREFADVKRLGWRLDQRLGFAAENELFDIRHLSVGKTAPEIE